MTRSCRGLFLGALGHLERLGIRKQKSLIKVPTGAKLSPFGDGKAKSVAIFGAEAGMLG